MATDTAMDTYKQGKKITGKADAMKVEAEEHLGQCKALTAAIADFAGSPVIGPVVFWVLHRIVALFTVAFFLYTLSAAVPTFSAKVTSADVEYLSEYQLPDIYVCLDGGSMTKFISKEKQSTQKQKCEAMFAVEGNCQCCLTVLNALGVITSAPQVGDCPICTVTTARSCPQTTICVHKTTACQLAVPTRNPKKIVGRCASSR